MVFVETLRWKSTHRAVALQCPPTSLLRTVLRTIACVPFVPVPVGRGQAEVFTHLKYVKFLREKLRAATIVC